MLVSPVRKSRSRGLFSRLKTWPAAPSRRRGLHWAGWLRLRPAQTQQHRGQRQNPIARRADFQGVAEAVEFNQQQGEGCSDYRAQYVGEVEIAE